MCPYCNKKIDRLNVLAMAPVDAVLYYEPYFEDEDVPHPDDFFIDHAELYDDREFQVESYHCPECDEIIADTRQAAESILRDSRRSE